MKTLDEYENKCGFKCSECPYEDCILDEEDGIEEELPIEEEEKKPTKSQKYYAEHKEKCKELQREWHKKHPEKRKEYYEKHKKEQCDRVKNAYSKRVRGQRRRRAVTNYDYIQSMDVYDLAEWLSIRTGLSDKAFLMWLNEDLKEGKLSEFK